MKKNIYDVLNDIEVDLNDIEKENFTELERKRAMKNFREKTQRTKSYKKYIGVAAAFVVSAGAVGSIPVFASTNPVMYSIANFLGIDKDLEDYATAIHKSVTKGDFTLQLNEVILDNEELIVSSTLTSKNKLEEGFSMPMGSVYVNGKHISTGGGGSSKQLDDYTVEEVMHYNLDEILIGDMDIKIIFKDPLVEGKVHKACWTFEFNTNGDELAEDTHTKLLNEEFILPNDVQISLQHYTSNNVGQKIYFTQSEKGTTYDMVLRGQDDLGNPVEFYLSHLVDREGLFKIDELHSKLSNEASSYTLEFYVSELPKQSGKLNSKFVKVGEAFTIQLR